MTPVIPDFDEVEHRYSHAGRDYPSNTQVLEALRLNPPYPEDRGQKAFGTAVHKAAELAIFDRLDYTRTAPVIMPYIEGLMEKSREMRIRPIKAEIRGLHTGEAYAGTIDLWCLVYDDEPAVIDYKTGVPPRCVELQTAGYGELAMHMGLTPRSKPPRRFSMQLLPGRAIVRECRDPFDYPAFIGAVRLFKWMNERRKGL